jgi:hypothetical protein
MILYAVNEHWQRPRLRLVRIPFSSCGYKLKAFVPTLYQTLSLQNTHTHTAMENATDSADVSAWLPFEEQITLRVPTPDYLQLQLQSACVTAK